MSKHSLRDEACDQAYWKQLNPDLHICERSLVDAKQLVFDQDTIESVKESIRVEGYFRLDQILDAATMDHLAQCVINIQKSGWPTPFAIVYDEYWEIFFSLNKLFSSILGTNYKQLPNFWCWYIEPSRKGRGWGCHRDRPSVNSMREDGSLDTLTIWIPLTNATVENGCIYVLPIYNDRNFPDHLEVSTIADTRGIRALPAVKGSVLGWTESILHWGSRSSSRAGEPRISISFSFQRNLENPYETPLFDTDVLPTWEERLGLIAQNVVKYQGHDSIESKYVEACEGIGNFIEAIQVEDGYKREVHDKDKRLSELQIWQEDNYERIREGKPFYPTNNSYFCQMYADILISFILDYAEHLDLNEPLPILDLNGGTGSFAYRFLNEFAKRKERFSRLKNLKLLYVLTATHEETIEHYSRVRRLKSLIESGVLDYALFNPETDSKINLRESGKTISKENLRNPLIAVSNHFFDSTKHDAFRILNGALQEGRYTTYRDSREHDLESPLRVEQLGLLKRYFDCPANFYNDKQLDNILHFYRTHKDRANIFMPIGAFRIISNLLRLSNNNLALFAVEKGFTSLNSKHVNGSVERKFEGTGHVSFNVNFDAIARYFQESGGTSLLEGGSHKQFCTTANLLLKNKEVKLERLNDCFADRIANRDYANSLSNIESLLRNVSWEDIKDRPKLAVLISMLQTYNFEPAVFAIVVDKLFESINQELPTIEDEQKQELLVTLMSVWKNIYEHDEGTSALDGIFRLHIGIQAFDKCLLLCQEALETFGPLPTVIDHTAICYEALGQFDQAYKYFHQAVEQVPDHHWAREGLERTKKHLATDKVAGVSTPPA